MSMQRRIQRNAAKRAEARAKIKSEGPQPGDVVVGCHHKPDPRFGSHCFYVGTDDGKPGLKLTSKNPDEEWAKWIFLCKECNDAFGSRIVDALAKNEVPLTLVHTWTEADGKLKIIPVVFEKDPDADPDPGLTLN